MIEKSMLLVTSTWDGESTFKLIPISLSCPYQEIIYVPKAGTLAVISKTPLQKYTMLPKMDSNGDVEYLKGKTRSNGKPYKEERRLAESYSEYFIEDKEEIRDFVAMFAINYKVDNDMNKWADKIHGFLNPPKKEVPPGNVTIMKPEDITETPGMKVVKKEEETFVK